MISFISDHHELFMWLTIASAIGFVASLILVPWIIIQMPADYFSYPERREPLLKDEPAALRLMGKILKNLFGVVFVFAGIAMLVLPGQGILTIFIGLLLMDFPYKYKVERWIIEKEGVLKAVNWIRAKANREPLSKV